MGLIELELITQYLDIVAGKSEPNKKVLLNIKKYLDLFKPKTDKLHQLQITNIKCTHNLIRNHSLILLQRTLKRLRTLDPYWMDSSLPCEFQEHLGKMLQDYKSIIWELFNRASKTHKSKLSTTLLYFRKMESEDEMEWKDVEQSLSLIHI